MGVAPLERSALIEISDAQINAWLTSLLWPFFRILGLLSVDPFYSSRTIPIRVRVTLALGLSLLLAPVLPPMPVVEPVSPMGVLIVAQQVLVGIAMGFVMRLMFAGAEMAGHLAGLQMGLGFASFWDPQHGTNSVVVAQFVSLLTLLLFLSMNGHLVLLEALVRSFQWLPVRSEPLHAGGLRLLAETGRHLFLLGVLLSMPVLAALLMANLAIGIMSRAAPQLNIYSVGFPLTLSVGVVMLYLTLPHFAPHVRGLVERGEQLMEAVVRALG